MPKIYAASTLVDVPPYAAGSKDRYFSFTVWTHSRPGIGRTYYEGKVDVRATDQEQAISVALGRLARIYGHRDWHIDRVDCGGRS